MLLFQPFCISELLNLEHAVSSPGLGLKSNSENDSGADKKGLRLYSHRADSDATPFPPYLLRRCYTSPFSCTYTYTTMRIHPDACHAPTSTNQPTLSSSKAKGAFFFSFLAPPRAIIAWYLTSLDDGWAVIDSSPTGWSFIPLFFSSFESIPLHLAYCTAEHLPNTTLSRARCFSFQFSLIIRFEGCIIVEKETSTGASEHQFRSQLGNSFACNCGGPRRSPPPSLFERY